MNLKDSFRKVNWRELGWLALASLLSFIVYMAYLLVIGIPATQKYVSTLHN